MVSVTTAPVSVGDLHMPQTRDLVSPGLPGGAGQHTLDVQKVRVSHGASVILEREDMEDPAKSWLCLAPIFATPGCLKYRGNVWTLIASSDA